MSHAKGPWKINNNYGPLMSEVLDKSGSNGIATVWTRKYKGGIKDRRGKTVPSKEGEENLRLIAAGPELLEACKLALNFKGYTTRLANTPMQGAFQIIEKAIIKAEGR